LLLGGFLVVVSWLCVDCFVVVESLFRGCLVVFDCSLVVVGWLWSDYLLLFRGCWVIVCCLFGSCFVVVW